MHIVTVARMFWVFGSLFPRRCGALRAGCCGSGIQMLSRRCGVSWVSCRGSGRLWSIYLFWTPAYFLIVRLVHYFFALRTCYMLRRHVQTKSHTGPSKRKRSGHEPHRASKRMPSFWQRATFSGSRPSQRYKTKRLKRPFVGRGETWLPVLALGCLSGGAVCPFGLSSYSPPPPIFHLGFCCVVFWVVGSASSVLVSCAAGFLSVLVFLGSWPLLSRAPT